MANNIGLPLTPGTLNSPTCWPATPQALYQEMFQKGSAQGSLLQGVVIFPSDPGPNYHEFMWAKVVGGVPQGVFLWNTVINQWVWPHTYPPGGGFRALFAGTLIELALFDGGDAGVPGVASGPMWVEDTDFAGRSPIGVGAIPTTTPPLSTTTAGENLGEGSHIMTLAELATHSHAIKRGGVDLISPDGPLVCADQNKGTHSDGATENQGSSTAFGIIHPVRSCYIIRRSDTRVWYLG